MPNAFPTCSSSARWDEDHNHDNYIMISSLNVKRNHCWVVWSTVEAKRSKLIVRCSSFMKTGAIKHFTTLVFLFHRLICCHVAGDDDVFFSGVNNNSGEFYDRLRGNNHQSATTKCVKSRKSFGFIRMRLWYPKRKQVRIMCLSICLNRLFIYWNIPTSCAIKKPSRKRFPMKLSW